MAGTNAKTAELSNPDKQKVKKKGKEAVASLTATLKALPPDQQVSTVMSKYSELFEENWKLQNMQRQLERGMSLANLDKEKAESEHSKAVLTRGRLESLCRELQKQNKLIMEENVHRLKEEQKKRKDLSDHLHNSLEDIGKVLKESTERNNELKAENIRNATRIQEILNEHGTMEHTVQQSIAQKNLELQIKEAEMAKAKLEFAEEREKMLREKKSLLEELSQYQDKVQKFSTNEVSLRSQLNSYSEKCDEFQDKIGKSNGIFKEFSSRMDDMTKLIKQYEKETKNWRDRWENANKSLLQMAAERTTMQSKMDLQNKQIEKLQNLCRALQKQNNEIRALQKQLESAESQLEDVSLSDSPKESTTEVQTASTDKCCGNSCLENQKDSSELPIPPETQ